MSGRTPRIRTGPLEFHHLEALIAVVEESSFSRAGDRVCRTQSAVSQAVKRLEELLGVPLIDRNSPRLQPTEAGSVILDYARTIVQVRERALRSISDLREASGGKITIASHESAAHYVLPALVRAFHAVSPGVQIEIQRQPVEEIPKRVVNGRTDFGFVTFRPRSRDVKSIELFRDPVILIVPPGHRLAGEKGVRIEDLGGEEFVAHHVRTPTTEKVLLLFDRAQIACHVAARLWSYENVKEFVRRGMGIASVPQMCIEEELRRGSLVKLEIEGLDFYRTICLIYRSESYLSEAGHRLLDMIRGWDWSNASGRREVAATGSSARSKTCSASPSNERDELGPGHGSSVNRHDRVDL